MVLRAPHRSGLRAPARVPRHRSRAREDLVRIEELPEFLRQGGFAAAERSRAVGVGVESAPAEGLADLSSPILTLHALGSVFPEEEVEGSLQLVSTLGFHARLRLSAAGHCGESVDQKSSDV
jgi:hypothetical protein